MAARDIPTPARNSSRMGSFNTGRNMPNVGSDQSAGGANLKNPMNTQDGGTAWNEGRSRLANLKEVHHNGGTMSIKQGSTEPPR